MATNSDSLYNVLYRIDNKPEMARINPLGYRNVLNMTFPDNSLLVDRFADDFVAKNGALLGRFLAKTEALDHGLDSVWVTTSHIVDQHEYMIELTFESSPM